MKTKREMERAENSISMYAGESAAFHRYNSNLFDEIQKGIIAMYDPDKQSRKFLITQNNPEKYGLTEETLLDMLNSMKIRYACFALEISNTGTPHYHIYIYFRSPAKFSTVKNYFPKADIEQAYGSSQENMEYITQAGTQSIYR